MSYVVVDIETTGPSRYYHKITEIAALRVKNGKVTREFETLINPQVRIPNFITRLTGIDNELVKDSPTVDEIMPAFVKFLRKDIFVAHNASFDFGFLSHNAEHYHKTKIPNDRLCTRKLANRLLPDLPSKKLGHICDHFDITNNQAHRAMGDTLATVEVLNRFLDILKGRKIEKTEQIIKFERSPRRAYVPVAKKSL